MIARLDCIIHHLAGMPLEKQVLITHALMPEWLCNAACHTCQHSIRASAVHSLCGVTSSPTMRGKLLWWGGLEGSSSGTASMSGLSAAVSSGWITSCRNASAESLAATGAGSNPGQPCVLVSMSCMAVCTAVCPPPLREHQRGQVVFVHGVLKRSAQLQAAGVLDKQQGRGDIQPCVYRVCPSAMTCVKACSSRQRG